MADHLRKTEKVIQLPEVPDATAVVYEAPVLEAANFEEDNDQTGTADVVDAELQQNLQELAEQDFVHLHVHSQFSILQAVSEVKKLVSTAKEMNMPAIALTDHGNMMAAFHFVRAALAADIKPIVGCEFNVCRNHEDKSQKDDGFQTVELLFRLPVRRNTSTWHLHRTQRRGLRRNRLQIASCAIRSGSAI